jgi:hypothetical protein
LTAGTEDDDDAIFQNKKQKKIFFEKEARKLKAETHSEPL